MTNPPAPMTRARDVALEPGREDLVNRTIPDWIYSIDTTKELQ
jgi:hypothetical protein